MFAEKKQAGQPSTRKALFIMTMGGLFSKQDRDEPVMRTPRGSEVVRSTEDRDAVLAPFQKPVIPPEAKLEPATARKLQSLYTNEAYYLLGQLLVQLVDGPAGQWRVHVDRSLGTYLFEIMYRLVEARLLNAPPTREQHDRTLRAAGLIARSKGRDFLVPDYIKATVLALGTAEHRLREGDIARVMDDVPVPAV